jgi:hypothetical protein
MMKKANEAGGSPSSPALEFGLFRKDHETAVFFAPPLTPPLTGRGNMSKMGCLRAQSARKQPIFD